MTDDYEIAMQMAAAVGERAADLIEDGHVKGMLSAGYKGVQNFCANGAISCALQEVCGECDVNHINGLTRANCETGEQVLAKSIYDLLVMFAKQEAEIRFGFIPTGLEANNVSSFNDRPGTSQSDVAEVLRAASKRLWELGLGDEPEAVRSWAPDELEEAPARQAVMAS